ncbi:hypothetical protein ACV22V_17160 [Burkholderia sp. AW33-5]
MAQTVGIDLPDLLKKARDANTDTVTIPATLPGGVQLDIVVYVFGRPRQQGGQGIGDINVVCN